jgi:hypothetical protein
MAGYQSLPITGPSTGLVQERQEFLLPNDAYPTLQNAIVWREKIIRKSGVSLLGRLQLNLGTTDGAGNFSTTIIPNPIQPGISSFTVGTAIFTDPGTPGESGLINLLNNGIGTATLNLTTGLLTITGSNALTAVQFFPGLPVMGIRIRELANSANDQTIFFDQNYAYDYNAGLGMFEQFIPGTTWNAAHANVAGINFFWSTNYWIGGTAQSPFGTGAKLFWVTNNSGSFAASADPPRITDGTTWVNFFPSAWSQIDATNFLTNWLCNLPFRGRMVTFNTWEGPGPTSASSLNYSNRIRWSTIGNPFIAFTAGPPAAGSWRSDIRGQGGFLDIPTSEDIVSIGFVRDNLIVYCERSTWQLRYTGRSIAPFQIERVNSELGTESTFSSVQFDTSLVGIGDKGIVECDSYKSERIDIKIPDLVYKFNGLNNGVARVQGIRDFPNRLAYWTIPLTGFYDGLVASASRIFPNIRLVYNYENDSWALFNDSLTALGNYQEQSGRTWLNTPQAWINCPFPWIDDPFGSPIILGGNQQGFILKLAGTTPSIGVAITNDTTLFITNIVGGSPITITSPNHNLVTNIVPGDDGSIIGISGIVGNFSFLNGGVYGVNVLNANTFTLYTYNPTDDAFSIATTGGLLTYQGGGLINILDNFSIVSKKFNFMDEGQNIQLGYLDILMNSTESGAISLNVYLDYNDEDKSNLAPFNAIDDGLSPDTPDTFFNSIIPTSSAGFNKIDGSKFWQRVFCPTRSNFITLQYTFNNAQMNGIEQQSPVQIDAQILHIRRAGRLTNI